jgi:hypothetical protein
MARAWCLLLTILAAARPVAGAHEKYVIQGFAPEYTSAIDAKPPDGFSTIELTAGTDNTSTKVSYSVARNGRRKGVAQMTRMWPMNCAGADTSGRMRAGAPSRRRRRSTGAQGSCPPCRSGRRGRWPPRRPRRPCRRGSPTAAEPSPTPSSG